MDVINFKILQWCYSILIKWRFNHSWWTLSYVYCIIFRLLINNEIPSKAVMPRCLLLFQSCLNVNTEQLKVIPDKRLCRSYKSLGSAVFLTRLSVKTVCLKWIQLSNLMCLSSNPMQKRTPSSEKAYFSVAENYATIFDSIVGHRKNLLGIYFFPYPFLF